MKRCVHTADIDSVSFFGVVITGKMTTNVADVTNVVVATVEIYYALITHKFKHNYFSSFTFNNYYKNVYK